MLVRCLVHGRRLNSKSARLHGCNVRNLNPEKAEGLTPELQVVLEDVGRHLVVEPAHSSEAAKEARHCENGCEEHESGVPGNERVATSSYHSRIVRRVLVAQLGMLFKESR
jgi:hypothetical protein